jgi:hypothetical protein
MFLFSACSDMLIPKNQRYKSIHLDGNGWVEVTNQNYECENGLRVFDNDFTFEVYFSGDNNNSDIAGTIFSLIGKKTENFIDSNCNGQFDNGELDSNEDGTIDDDIDDEFVIIAIQNDPSIENLLSFYVNDSEEEVIFEGMNFNNPNEFHLFQVTSDGDSIKFYLDRVMAYSVEADIMIQESSLFIGASGNGNNVNNIWDGYIDEVRLWNQILSKQHMDLHFESSNKLIETMQDSSICNLVGLWSFNYLKETIEISDEKCSEANNLYFGVCGFDMCDYPLDGTLYTSPNTEVKFSRNGF